MTTAYQLRRDAAPEPQTPQRDAEPTEADWRFCATMLPKVSRTFALSIGALPATLRDPVRIAYLLCRTVDTIEDDAVVVGDERERLYDAFDSLLRDDAVDPGRFTSMCAEAKLGKGSDDETLCREAGAVFRCYRALPSARRSGIRPHVLEMSRGMREFTRRADRVGHLRLRDIEELERYCYFVAGTVGKLLTALFENEVGRLPRHLLTAIRARAVSFGVALQLVNIVKDVAEDLPRGDCFLPEDLARAEGVRLEEILEAEHRRAGLGIIRAVCERAREHLRRAEQYTLLWPADTCGEVRMFCTVPLVLALATLHEVERGADTLVAGKTPKISRQAVEQIFADARIAIARNDTLRWMIGYYASGAYLTQTPIYVASASSPPPKASEPPPSAAAPRKKDDGNGSSAKRFRGKVLVTGAAGHLGANMVHRLLAEGRDVRVLLRHDHQNEAMEGLAVEKKYGDLRDEQAVAEAVAGCETIFHCASMVSTLQGDDAHKRELYGCNVIGTRNLLRAAKQHGVKRVVYTGSFSATGYDVDDSSQPSAEHQPFYPFATHLPYARTKVLGEHECLKAVADGLDVVMVTSTAILGPHDYKPSRMGQTLMDHTRGKLRAYIPGGFEFVAARDIVEGHLLAMEKGRTGQKYTIATQFMTLDDILAIFEDVTGVPKPRLRLPPRLMFALAHVSSFVLTNFFPKAPQRFTPDAVRILRLQRHANTEKARTELGFQPTSIADAIAEAYDDFARRGLVPPRKQAQPVTKEPRDKARAGAAA